jgi:hypothetical protein
VGQNLDPLALERDIQRGTLTDQSPQLRRLRSRHPPLLPELLLPPLLLLLDDEDLPLEKLAELAGATDDLPPTEPTVLDFPPRSAPLLEVAAVPPPVPPARPPTALDTPKVRCAGGSGWVEWLAPEIVPPLDEIVRDGGS